MIRRRQAVRVPSTDDRPLMGWRGLAAIVALAGLPALVLWLLGAMS